jgi:hypothetical protein
VAPFAGKAAPSATCRDDRLDGTQSNLLEVVMVAEPEVLDLHGAAALLRVSPAAALREAREGRLPGRQIDEEWRFSRAHLLQWLGGEDGPAVTPQPASQSGEGRAGQDLEGLAARTTDEPTPAERAALDEKDALGER